MFRKNAFSTILAIGALLAITLGLLLLSKPVHAGPSKVEVCHLPPGELDNFHTITISDKALGAHVEHGDLEGACDGVCAALCDDGDACTIDDTGDCSVNGCPVERTAVNCDDGNNLTNDYCDSGSGCINVCIDGYVDDGNGTCVPIGGTNCPCFDAAALDAVAADVLFCGDLGGGTVGVLWDSEDLGNEQNVITACAGPECLIPNDGYSCGLNDTFAQSTDIPMEVSNECAALISAYCQGLGD